MPSVTTQVQVAIREIPLGDLFTARDIAVRIGINHGVVGKILADCPIGSEFVRTDITRYKYPNGKSQSRRVKIYRRVALCPTS